MSLMRTLGIVVSALALLLQACAGGSETGTGLTTGKSGKDVSVGTITKFGSVWVNGVEFETGKTQVKLEGAGSTYSALKLGMVVTVKGTINADGVSGSADQILAEEVIKGPVATVGSNSFTVLGQEVLVNETTRFEDPLTFATWVTALKVAELVEVSGIVKSTGVSAGVIIATRVERKDTLDNYKLKGIASNIDAMAKTFSIGTLSVNYTGVGGLPNGVPVDGLLVEVKGSLVNGILIATSLEAEKLDVEDADKFEIEGYVGVVSGSGTAISFTLNNVAVQTTATTEFSAGLGTDLVPGVFVEIEGKLQGGVVSASHVEFREGVTLESLVASKITTTATTLTLAGFGGLNVVVDSETELEGVNNITEIVTDTFPGAHRVTVRGRYDAGSKKVIATRIKAEVSGGDQKVVLQGPFDGFVDPTLTVMGLSMDTSTIKRFNGPVDRNTFFAAVAVGDIVNVEGTLIGGTATWEDIELED